MREVVSGAEGPVGEIADEGAISIRLIRQAIGYSLDEAALTSGLTVDELAALEAGADSDTAKIQRVAAALGRR